MPGVKGQRSGGRNRKTTAELEASGGVRRGRHANRADIVGASGSPKKPRGLSAKQKQLWDAVVDVMPEAALGSADTSVMTEMCRWFGVYLKSMDKLEKDPQDYKLMTATVKAWQEFRKVAMDYGLTPQSRAAIKVPQKGDDEESPFEQVLNRMKGSVN